LKETDMTIRDDPRNPLRHGGRDPLSPRVSGRQAENVIELDAERERRRLAAAAESENLASPP
jgi:hypothetical protein